MKTLSKKQKIIFIITIIFFCTSVAVKIKNFNSNMKSINSKKVTQRKNENDFINSAEKNRLNTSLGKSKDNLQLKINENLQSNEKVDSRILELWGTLQEAVKYLKNNIDNQDKKEEIKVLIDDSINALNSIENALAKIKNQDKSINLTKDIKELKEDFKKLKKAFEEGNLDKCKEILK